MGFQKGASRTLFCFYFVAALALTLLWNPEARAQISSSTGAIQGAVTDPQNATIAGAIVLLTNTDTGVQVAQGTTQSDGGYVFPLLPPGNYKVEVQAQGFDSTVLDGIKVDVTKITVANGKLRLGAVSTQITVSEVAEAVDTRTATTGDVIENKQIVNIPLPTRSF